MALSIKSIGAVTARAPRNDDFMRVQMLGRRINSLLRSRIRLCSSNGISVICGVVVNELQTLSDREREVCIHVPI